MKFLSGLCIIVVALLIAVPVFAQVPIGATGNLLAVGNYNVNAGSSDLGTVLLGS